MFTTSDSIFNAIWSKIFWAIVIGIGFTMALAAAGIIPL
jgi:hypothetical protein